MPEIRRRAVLAAGAAVGVSTMLSGCFAARDAAPTPSPSGDTGQQQLPIVVPDSTLQAFDADVARAMMTFGMVGAAVALTQGNSIVYNRGFGIRSQASGAPVTVDTRFRIGSNTKSMTSLLIATYVDQGICDWSTRAQRLYPAFRGPTAALTQQLTVAELLGMGTGIAEPAKVEFFAAAGDRDALDVLRSVETLEVIAKPAKSYYYNNTLVSVAPYLAMMASGTDASGLAERYADDLRMLVFEPAGMSDAIVGSDPRPFGPDYATGHTRALDGTVERAEFVSIGGYDPAGSVQASSTDMARYLIAQVQNGVAFDGTTIASTDSVARTHQPGVGVPPNALNALPDLLLDNTTSMNYALGWFSQLFTNGVQLLWHAGGIDGFGSLMGFFPASQIGFVFLTNLEPSDAGLFTFSIQASLLDRLFGLNKKLPETLAAAVPTIRQTKRDLAATAGPVDASTIAPYLGLYSDGFELGQSGDDIVLTHDIRSATVRAVTSGDYLIVNGPGAIAGKAITLATAADATRSLTIAGFDPCTWLSGD